ncbi:MAG TPA: hypothetical protein VJW76_17245, partial [Verrucomicrobiae bacterium]|nr:hypothetical protein [Verrucomicrobiae bacterium]
MISFNPAAARRAASPLQRRVPACRNILVIMWCLMTLLATRGADKSVDPKSLPTPKRVLVPRLTGPVTVDGDLNEPVWAKATKVSPFFRN